MKEKLALRIRENAKQISFVVVCTLVCLCLLQAPHRVLAQNQSGNTGGIVNQSGNMGGPQNLGDYVTLFLQLYGLAVPILTGLAFLLFFWGVAKFILSAGNQKELAVGRQYMIWGVIALFILITIWGIIQFMSNELGFTPGTLITQPLLPTS
jgi:hypothetical protein